MKLLCIDGNSVLNRAFYAIKLLTTKVGRYTNAIYVFMCIFLNLIEQFSPDAVAVAFDLRAKTFRHKMYDGYKANRKGMPEELAGQMQPLKELLAMLGYTTVTCEGFEADDILGTFADACRKSGDTCYIATGDRDSLQLVGGGVSVLLTTTQMGRGETNETGEAEVFEKYGVTPRRLIEVKALMGDSSDNIPGVAGVGEKTALSLIQKFGTLDGVYENIDSAEIKDGVRAKLVRDKETAYMSRALAEINCEVPIDTDCKTYIRRAGDPQGAARLLGELEMHSIANRLELDAVRSLSESGGGDRAEIKEKATKQIELLPLDEEIISKSKELFVTVLDEEVYCSAGDRAYVTDAKSLGTLLASDVKKYCYDAKTLFHRAIDLGVKAKNIVFDLKLAAYLLSPASANYILENLKNEYGAVPIFECGADNLGVTEPLCKKLEGLLEEQGMKKLHDEIELPLAGVLAEMEHIGFMLDVGGIKGFGIELCEVIEREQEIIWEMIGRKINVNSPKQLGEALFETLKLPVGKKTKSGFSTNAETLERLVGVHPIIEHILSYRTYQKLNSTYVEGLMKAVDVTGRIHTEFKQTETRTGRISSREPNLQNIPVRTELGSRFRKYFISEKGRVLLDADYSQIELRVLASMSGDTKMIDAFTDGRDIHTETASEIFKIPRTMVTPELRRRAKAVNFGIVYGIGAFSLAQDVGVSMREAKEYIDSYLATYSGIAAYLADTVKRAQSDGYVTTLYGRRRALPELASSNKMLQALGKRLAMNTPIQGTAADIIKLAMIRVRDRLKKENLDAQLVLQVHDELIVESSYADKDRAAALLHEEMEAAAELKAPLVAQVNSGESWYDAK
ncbi:MAG: DNA polymerase I [Oscillospiraceae bacterium]